MHGRSDNVSWCIHSVWAGLHSLFLWYWLHWQENTQFGATNALDAGGEELNSERIS